MVAAGEAQPVKEVEQAAPYENRSPSDASEPKA
jgi:hypothetical protein